MTMNLTPTFKNPTFRERIGGMLGVDFYRLFHTPLFYIMLAISAIIPAMILSMTGMDGGKDYTRTPGISSPRTRPSISCGTSGTTPT